jgi:hypothetical protein
MDMETHTYRIKTTGAELMERYEFGNWEPASDLEEVWFIDVPSDRADHFESLLNRDATVLAYEIVRTVAFDGTVIYDAAGE